MHTAPVGGHGGPSRSKGRCVSGQGRKKSNHGAGARRSNPPSRKGAGPAKPRPPGAATNRAAAPAPERNPATQPTGGTRPRTPEPAAGSGSRRPTRPPAQRSPAQRSPAQRARPARPPREARRKRNQRVGVLIGALALAGALVGSVLLGQRDGSTAQAQNPGATTAGAPSSAKPAPVTSAAPTTAAAPAALIAITCPTGGGATTAFGHEISQPEPYTVTITYGDGDKYTNDSAHVGAIFSHTYKSAGSYAVTAVLNAPGGATATANCTYTWGP
jgi:hypothetical protein